MSWFAAARAYSRVYGFTQDHLGFNLKGLGIFLRRIREDHVLPVQGALLHLDHRVATCYGRLITGRYHEPETHVFLRRVLDAVGGRVQVVDVGANVGEFLLDLGRHPAVAGISAYEPFAACAAACRETARLNGYGHVRVRETALADRPGTRAFVADALAPNGSHLAVAEKGNAQVTTSTLDEEFPDPLGPTIVIIDVEGSEPLVLAGGRRLIERDRPLIVFEYNDLSRRAFTMADVRAQLAPGYTVWRLRRDGRLDQELERSWNCVAVPGSTPFEHACLALRA